MLQPRIMKITEVSRRVTRNTKSIWWVSYNADQVGTSALRSPAIRWEESAQNADPDAEPSNRDFNWSRSSRSPRPRCSFQANNNIDYMQQAPNSRVEGQAEEVKRIIADLVKENMFFGHYLQAESMKAFLECGRVEYLSFGSVLDWRDQDCASKIAIIFKGAIVVEYTWRRIIRLAEITQGMMFCNRSNKNKKSKERKLHFTSKASSTGLLIFDARIFEERPFTNHELLPHLERQYANYLSILSVRISFDEEIRLFRKKESIKAELKKAKTRQRHRSSLELEENSSRNLTQRQLSSSLVAIPTSGRVDTLASNTSLIQISGTTQRLKVHNSWIENSAKRPKNTKTFSTLRRISIHQAQRDKLREITQSEKKQRPTPNFFVPEQFVKKTLRIKYQATISKLKNMDLSLQQSGDRNLKTRLKKLEEEVECNRIVKLSNAKRRNKYLRERVQY